MKKTLFLSLLTAVVLGVFGISLISRAYAPTLSLYATGNNSVQITVNGDSNSSVFLYYPQNYYGQQSQYLGSTNSSGYFSTTVSASSYNINPGSSVYVLVGNQQSQSVSWPYNSYNYGGSVSLSQTSVSLSIDQSTSISIIGNSKPYKMYPSSYNVFNSVIAENTLTVTGRNTGTATLSVCNSDGNNCATLNVSVNTGSNNNQQITLSQNSITLNTGNNTTVNIYGGGNYYISNHSNSNVASAYISGNTLNVTASNPGTDNITICQGYNYGGYYSQCAVLYVTVNNNNNQISTAVTFSQANPNINTGQSLNISIYGGSGSGYYVSYNSNANAIQTSLNSNTLSITGGQNGIFVVAVCSSSYSCGAITVTVGSGNYNNNQNNWTYCAQENQYCYFSGTQNVRYGANGNYYYRTFTNSVLCSNSVFGDPAFMSSKQCSYSN